MARIKRARRWPGEPGARAPRRPKTAAPPAAPRKRAAPPELRPFQREGVEELAAAGWRALLADAPGCGKTPQALVAIAENARTLCPALIVVPPSVLHNWQAEAERWLPGIRVQVLDKVDSPLRRGVHLTITTWDLAAVRREALLGYGFRLLVCDEAHYAKNPETQRYAAIQALAARCPHLILLTGTPVLNDVDELEALFALFGEDRPPMIRRLLEDVAPDIPRKRRVSLYAEIPADIRREYEQVVAEFADWLDDYLPRVVGVAEAPEAADRALAAEPLAKLAYLRRILGRGKVPAAAAWIGEMVRRGEPVVVFGHYADVLDLLGQALAKLGIAYVRLDGSTPAETRTAAVAAFQRGDVPVFLGSSAAREGITLVRSAHLLRLERDYVPAYEEQAEDRIRRIGQTRTTTIWYLHAENTIDQRISEIVEEKRRLVAQTIGSATVESTELDEILDVWRRVPALRAGVPLVASNPRASIDLPEFPVKARSVQAVLLDPARWPLDAVQREVRRRGLRVKDVQRVTGGIRLECRALSAFQGAQVRLVQLAPGLAVAIGRRAQADADRMRAGRRVRRIRSRRVGLSWPAP